MAGCSLSKQQVRDLDANTPRWQIIIAIRLMTVVVACFTAAAFGICIGKPSYDMSADVWTWNDKWIGYFVFVPPTLSLIQTLITIPYLLATTRTPHPAIEVIVELGIILITAFPMIFCTTVSGPLQLWRDPQSLSSPSPILAGIMELVGLIGLLLLEILHLVLLVWACQRTHSRREFRIARARAAAEKLEMGWGIEEIEVAQPKTKDEARQQEWPPKARGPFGDTEEGIGIAIGKDDLWVPISELRNESRLYDHEDVVVRDGEVVMVEKKLEFGIGFRMPEDEDVIMAESEGVVARSPDPDMPPPLKVRKSMKLSRPVSKWEVKDESSSVVINQGW